MKRFTLATFCLALACLSCSKKGDVEVLDQVIDNALGGAYTYSFAGNDFQVNTYKDQNQNYPKVAITADGKTIVVWESAGQDGDGHAVACQRYNADGTPWGDEFIVNTETVLAQSQPSVAVDKDGSHIILWRSKGQDGSDFGVYAQRYDASGDKVGGEFRVNQETDSDQDLAYAAYHNNGNLMIIWQSENQDGKAGEIYARVYDDQFNDISNGEFRVNTVIDGWQNTARIAAVPSGFVVVWESLNIDNERLTIVFKRFSSDGTALMNMEQQVNTREICDQKNPDIAAQVDGKFAIVWEHLEDPDKCNSVKTEVTDITARMYDSDGTPLTDEVILSQNTSGNQNLGIAHDHRGGFVAIWQGDASANDNTDEIYARRFLNSGEPDGNMFKVNSKTDSYQVFPAIAAAPDGNLFAVWGSWSGDGNGTSIRARRLN